MFYLMFFLHLIAAFVLILVVLLQSGKAGDLASAFGGTSSQTAFGVRSAATMLTKVTTAAAIIFLLSSLGLAIYYNQGTESTIMDRADTAAEQQATPESAVPAPPPATEQPAQETPASQPETPPPDGGGTNQ